MDPLSKVFGMTNFRILRNQEIARTILSAIFSLCLAAAASAEVSILQPGQTTEPAAQSTSGPKRPESQQSTARAAADAAAAMDYQVLIDGVPSYIWHRGCAPTAAGMVLGYWDGHGYPDIVAGAATTQTTAVDSMIASSGHYEDYSKPLDYYPNMVPDGSETNVGGCHLSNSIGDFMKTSQSVEGNYWGWTWSSDIDNGVDGYLGYAAPQYTGSAQNVYWSSMTWNRLCQEIDSNHPALFLVDTDGNNGSDHFVTVIGYGEKDGTNMYACYDTYNHDVHWYTFQGMGTGIDYGIWGGTYFSMVSPPASGLFAPTSPSPSDGATNVEIDVVLSWANGGGAEGYDIYFGTNPSPDASEYATSQAGTTYTPASLSEGVEYFWRVDATNTADGTTTGAVWSFTTRRTITHYVAPGGHHISPYTNWYQAATSLQAAINICAADNFVVVSNGVYTPGARLAIGDTITVTSVNGPDVTIIDGQDSHALLMMGDGLLRGFTLRNGSTAGDGGGVLFDRGGVVENCIIKNNSADNGGGARFLSGGTLRSCVVASNSASSGGGLSFSGGGLLENCTVAYNYASANRGGGGFYTDGSAALVNTIVYYNTGKNADNYFEDAAGTGYTNCCTTPAVVGTSIITDPPGFADHLNGDYTLTNGSPCVDTGVNQVWMNTATELDGKPRILNTIVDRGAFEYGDPPVQDCVLTVSSAYGTPTPVIGTHTNPAGTLVTGTVDGIVLSGTTQFVCEGWTMTGNEPASGVATNFTMTHTNDATLTWNWSTDCYFAVSSTGSGVLSGATRGWYDMGGHVTVTATPEDTYRFAGWQGDLPTALTNDNPLDMDLAYACSITARFAYVEPPANTSCSFTGDIANTAWSAEPAARYRLMMCTNLCAGEWQQAGSIVTATTETVSLAATNDFDNCIYYRAVRILP
jgi:hypothetical protein